MTQQKCRDACDNLAYSDRRYIYCHQFSSNLGRRNLRNVNWNNHGCNPDSQAHNHPSDHQFRHILAKLILDTKPGQLEEVKNLLRHRNLKTTTTFYAELDTLQSSRDHNELIDKLRKGKLGDDE